MPRVLARAIRLVKIGAVAGAAVGIGRLIVRRRRLADTGESSWPTIAETAAQNGHPVDDEADTGSSDTEQAEGASDTNDNAETSS